MKAHSGIRSWFQNDEKVSNAIENYEKTNDPWSHYIQFYNYDNLRTKVGKFALAFITALISLGFIPTIAIVHDSFFHDRSGRLDSFKDISKDIQSDADRMQVNYIKSSGSSHETITLDQLHEIVHNSFEGEAMKTALYLRATGQGPSVKLKEMLSQTNDLGEGDVFLGTGVTKDSAVFDLAAKTVTVTYHQTLRYMPTQSELAVPSTKQPAGGKYYTSNHIHAVGIELDAMVMTAIFDFNHDTASYKITPDTTDFDRKALYVHFE